MSMIYLNGWNQKQSKPPPARGLWEDDMSNQDYIEQCQGYPWAGSKTSKQSEPIAMKTAQALRDLGWKDPEDVQDMNTELGEGKTTMLVNFGPKGKCRPGLVTSRDKLTSMIVKVFSYYEGLTKDE